MFRRKCLLLQNNHLFCIKKSKFWPAPTQVGTIFFCGVFVDNSVWYNLKSGVCQLFFKNVQFFRYWKSEKISGYLMHTFIQDSCPVVFQHFRVSLAACVIDIHLGHSFYININKNTISCFNTENSFVILVAVS